MHCKCPLLTKADIGHVVGHIIQSALLGAGIGPNPEKTNGGTDADALRFWQFSVLPKSANYDVRQGAHMGSAKVDLFKAEQYDPKYLKLNPKGVVPTLVHDGKAIIESTLICEISMTHFLSHD